MRCTRHAGQVSSPTIERTVMGGHSESVNVEFRQPFELEEVIRLLSATPGVVVEDDIKNLKYPMPLHAHKQDDVFVGRLRIDETQPNTLNMWVVSDNLRKGAATNAIQIAEYMVARHLVMS